jgi:hypothetical protein
MSPSSVWKRVAVAAVVVAAVVAVVVTMRARAKARLALSAGEAVDAALQPRDRVENAKVTPIQVLEVLAETSSLATGAAGGATNVSAAVRRVTVKRDQVLAVVNGVPVSGADLMPGSRFKGGAGAAMDAEVWQEVLGRAIDRELMFQAAQAQGVTLTEAQQGELAAIHGHLTGNPLRLQGGETVVDLNVGGEPEDVLFRLRERAARLLQVSLLEKSGLADTSEARQQLIGELRGAAAIQTAPLSP